MAYNMHRFGNGRIPQHCKLIHICSIIMEICMASLCRNLGGRRSSIEHESGREGIKHRTFTPITSIPTSATRNFLTAFPWPISYFLESLQYSCSLLIPSLLPTSGTVTVDFPKIRCSVTI
jgi:hypothetical protein